MDRVPEVGKTYTFYDDGKLSRPYEAKVLRVIPYNEDIIVDKFDYDLGSTVPTLLKEIHKEAVDNHRQRENFVVINNHGADSTPGSPWLYAEDTDYFIECEIPEYDDNPIWFARMIDGGWFSMDIQSSWQSGELDVEGRFNKYN